jgi:hypothetical protein
MPLSKGCLTSSSGDDFSSLAMKWQLLVLLLLLSAMSVVQLIVGAVIYGIGEATQFSFLFAIRELIKNKHRPIITSLMLGTCAPVATLGSLIGKISSSRSFHLTLTVSSTKICSTSKFRLVVLLLSFSYLQWPGNYPIILMLSFSYLPYASYGR